MTSPPIEPTKNTQHTGGWTVERYGEGDSLVIHDGPDIRVCFMATPGASPGAMDRIERRAALIASAPELLEALKECKAVLGMLTEPKTIRSTSVHGAWAQAVAAEAKARAAILRAESR